MMIPLCFSEYCAKFITKSTTMSSQFQMLDLIVSYFQSSSNAPHLISSIFSNNPVLNIHCIVSIFTKTARQSKCEIYRSMQFDLLRYINQKNPNLIIVAELLESMTFGNNSPIQFLVSLYFYIFDFFFVMLKLMNSKCQ